MGSTKFEGGLLQSVYKWNKLNYPQLKDYNQSQKNKDNTMITQYTSEYKDTRKCKWDQHMSQACPNNTYSIGPLSLATTKALKTQEGDASPSGILNPFLNHTTISKWSKIYNV